MRWSARAFPRLAVALVVTLAGCGRNHQRTEQYVAAAAAPLGDPALGLYIYPTRTDEDAGIFGDREIREVAPYTIVVVARRTDEIESPLRVHAVRLHVGDRAQVIHDATSPALEAALEEVAGKSKEPWAATVRLPLGDRLAFVEGQTVSLDASVTLPGADAPTAVSRTYRAEVNEWSGSKLEGYLSQ